MAALIARNFFKGTLDRLSGRKKETTMGIDGIGKKGPPLPPSVGEATRAPQTGRAFEPRKPEASAKVVPIEGRALEQLKSGAIDLNQYLDLKVSQSTEHLSALHPLELDSIRRALRDRLSSDPTLADLVRTATGSVPQPSGDE
jgi:hypothetical protein